MIRYLKYAFLAALGLILFALALANRELVDLRILSDEAATLLGVPNKVSLPLFLVIFLSLAAGILVGLVWEWFREHRFRAEAAARKREAEALKRDLGRARAAGAKEPADDVLALLE